MSTGCTDVYHENILDVPLTGLVPWIQNDRPISRMSKSISKLF